MMKIIAVLITSMILLVNNGRAEIYVVAHQSNPLQTLDREQLRDLYLSRSNDLNTDQPLSVYDRNIEGLRQRFIENIVGMNVRQFDAYWARLIFAGRVLPLNEAGLDVELFKNLEKDKYAIGYTDQKPSSPQFKTLLVVNE